MKLKRILDWIDGLLECGKFDDVSNNGLQIARRGEEVDKVAFAVDGSVKSVKAAAAAGAQLLVVHHGISWGGGVKRLTGGEYEVVKAAMDSDLALAAFHLPLDANREVGNNWELARFFGLENVRPAFNYHGNIIGVIGEGRSPLNPQLSTLNPQLSTLNSRLRIGVCSGGAGAFAADAKALGCDLYVTGEADWGEKIAAENIGMPMICAGHYETETFGVKALMKAMAKALKLSTVFVSLFLGFALHAESYIGAGGALTLPQGGSRLRRLGGAAVRGGYYVSDWFAAEAEAASLEDRAGLAVRGVAHWKGWNEWDMLFGFSRCDPFFTVGAKGYLPDGQVGPAVGVGFLYYISDDWALRCDGEAALGLDTRTEMMYSLSVGLQYSF